PRKGSRDHRGRTIIPLSLNHPVDTYGRSERSKYRAVVYYMLTKHFGKESVYS
ncbi:MAG: DUF2853 family protein, partial [Rhodobacterales bacterium]|nr:DUF2853 family protein [Rhodobacterales bacterium]